MPADPAAIERKLEAARTRLILDRPFLGALVLRLPLHRADPAWCRTLATDARALYFNAGYVAALSGTELEFMLAHEALHCGLGHFARRGRRDKPLWDLACDFAINALLVDEGMTPPPGAPWLALYRGLAAEDIYPLLDLQDRTETLDDHVYDADRDSGGTTAEPAGDNGPAGGGAAGGQPAGEGAGAGEDATAGSQGSDVHSAPTPAAGPQGAPRPPPPGNRETEALRAQWQQRLVQAAQQALQAGKLGGRLARVVDALIQPALPWRALLARYVSQTARDDYNWSRPSSRRGDPAIFPSLRSASLSLAVAVDTSGSLTNREIGEFLGELSALKAQFRCEVLLLVCDARLAEGGPWHFAPWEELRLPERLAGGGGTDFRPVFAHVDALDRPPDALVYFTDALGTFPERTPPWPVLWLVKGGATVPWGQRVQLN